MYYYLVPIVICFIIAVFGGGYTESPFATRQLKEISTHMTKAERRAAIIRGFLGGLLFSIIFGAIGLLLGLIIFKSALMGMVFCALLLPLVAFILWKKWFPHLYKSQQSFFASTEWAKSQGIEANDIKLFNFQKQK
jgi:hypothetical protein